MVSDANESRFCVNESNLELDCLNSLLLKLKRCKMSAKTSFTPALRPSHSYFNERFSASADFYDSHPTFILFWLSVALNTALSQISFISPAITALTEAQSICSTITVFETHLAFDCVLEPFPKSRSLQRLHSTCHDPPPILDILWSAAPAHGVVELSIQNPSHFFSSEKTLFFTRPFPKKPQASRASCHCISKVSQACPNCP